MRSSEVCRHDKVEFLGYQEVPGGKPPLPLYNCLFCHSTIVIEDKHKGRGN